MFELLNLSEHPSFLLIHGLVACLCLLQLTFETFLGLGELFLECVDLLGLLDDFGALLLGLGLSLLEVDFDLLKLGLSLLLGDFEFTDLFFIVLFHLQYFLALLRVFFGMHGN